jgi:peptidoglycan/LPS O-acetylase OafA/YrhL
VVIGHTINHSGYAVGKLGVFKLFALPVRAVDCFIMLSGFVIFYLLDSQRVPYKEFITRRFFRIAPLYLVVLVVSIVSLDWQVAVIRDYPWQSEAVIHDLKMHIEAIDYLTPHIIAHLSMLHGLVSDHILPGSEFALIGQAWSISVEWQFYLVAPLLFGAVSRGKWKTVCCALLVVCGIRAYGYAAGAFIVNQAGFFLAGIFSYYLWRYFRSAPAAHASLIQPGAAVALAAVYLIVPNSLSLLIWVAMMGAVLAETCQLRQGVFAKAAQVLRTKPFQFLGKISYSVYMTHMFVLYLWATVFSQVLPAMDKPQYLVWNVLAVVGTTIPLSMLCYRLIEAPGIKLGSLLLARRIVVPVEEMTQSQS